MTSWGPVREDRDTTLYCEITESVAWELGLILHPGSEILEGCDLFDATPFALPSIFSDPVIVGTCEFYVQLITSDLASLVGSDPGCFSKFERLFRGIFRATKSAQSQQKRLVKDLLAAATDPAVQPGIPDCFRGEIPRTVFSANIFIVHIRFKLVLDAVRELITILRERPDAWFAGWKSVLRDCTDIICKVLPHILNLEASARASLF